MITSFLNSALWGEALAKEKTLTRPLMLMQELCDGDKLHCCASNVLRDNSFFGGVAWGRVAKDLKFRVR